MEEKKDKKDSLRERLFYIWVAYIMCLAATLILLGCFFPYIESFLLFSTKVLFGSDLFLQMDTGIKFSEAQAPVFAALTAALFIAYGLGLSTLAARIQKMPKGVDLWERVFAVMPTLILLIIAKWCLLKNAVTWLRMGKMWAGTVTLLPTVFWLPLAVATVLFHRKEKHGEKE